MKKFSALPLRAQKNAKVKVDILHAFLEEMQDKRLEQIKVDDICAKVSISQKTFFNHFSTKERLISYFIQLHSFAIEETRLRCKAKKLDPLESIKQMFLETADAISTSANIMLELIHLQTKVAIAFDFEISDAEKWYFFPDIADIERFDGGGFDYHIMQLIEQAKEDGLLISSTDTQFLYLSIMSLFYGSSVLLLKLNPKQYARTLERMIQHNLTPYLKEKP